MLLIYLFCLLFFVTDYRTSSKVSVLRFSLRLWPASSLSHHQPCDQSYTSNNFHFSVSYHQVDNTLFISLSNLCMYSWFLSLIVFQLSDMIRIRKCVVDGCKSDVGSKTSRWPHDPRVSDVWLDTLKPYCSGLMGLPRYRLREKVVSLHSYQYLI